MGSQQSRPEITEEKQRWTTPHELMCDEQLAVANLKPLSKLGPHLRVGWMDMTLHNPYAELRHYFITDNKVVIEFGSVSKGITGGPVSVHGNVPKEYRTEKIFDNTSAVRDRIKDVAGTTNYCLLMRNSEHFARYIAGGGWTSMMTVEGSPVYELFKGGIAALAAERQLINAPPQELRRSVKVRRLYKQEAGFILPNPSQKDILSQDDADDGFNVVVLGPTGSGKSYLINLLFNTIICKSAGGSKSVTQEMKVIQGCAEIHGVRRLVNVVDTIGFCDTAIETDQLHKIIKHYIKATLMTIHKVVIVCAGRLEPEHAAAIKDFLKWLNYKDYPDCFGLVHTKCDGMDAEERYASLCDVCSTLGITTGYQRWLDDVDWLPPSSVMTGKAADQVTSFSIPYNLAVSFPPSAAYSEIEEDLHSVLDVVCTPPTRAMTIDEDDCFGFLRYS